MKKRKDYASKLTKDYLIKLGITDVTPDGYHIYKGTEEVAQYLPKSKNVKRRYLRVSLYDPDIRAATPVAERNASTGTIAIPVHVINYVWNKGTRDSGLVVDHIDNNPLNNNISNLQLLTQKENLAKERGESTRQLQCKLDKPLSFYQDKLAMYEEKYEEAKRAHDANLAHRLRCNISGTEARIRYWEAHREEAEALIAKKEAYAKTKLDSDVYHAKAQVIRLLKENISKRRTEYDDALETNGSTHETTLKLKAEWKRARKELTDFEWAARGSDKSYLPELINIYTKRALSNF